MKKPVGRRPARTAAPPAAIDPGTTTGAAKQINATVIVRKLVQRIARGDYKPGDRIREQAIAEDFNVSRSPVREAFRILEAKGVLTFEPMCGVTVRHVGQDEAKELVDISAALFGLAARYAARNATSEDCEQIRAGAAKLGAMAGQHMEPKYFFFETLETGYQLLLASKTRRIADEVLDSRLGAPDLLGPACFETLEARVRIAALWSELAEAVTARDPHRAERIAVDIHNVAAGYALRVVSGAAGTATP